MKNRRVRRPAWLPLAALAATLACGDTPREEPGDVAGTGEPAAETTSDTPAPDAPAAADADAAADAPWTAPLSDLLRLRQMRPPPERPLYEPPAAPPARTEREGKDPRVRVEVDRRRESSEIDRDVSRTRTEAGFSVSVDGSTRVRGGVRVEEEGEEREEPTPMIGVEKRF